MHAVVARMVTVCDGGHWRGMRGHLGLVMSLFELTAHVSHLMKVNCHHTKCEVCPFLYGHIISIKNSSKINGPYFLS